MKRFCYRCGALEAQQGPLIQGLCQHCFAKENRLLQAPAELEVTVCGRCGAYLLGKRWHEAERGDTIANAIRATVLSNLKVARLSDAGTKFFHPHEVPELELWVEPKLAERVINVRAKRLAMNASKRERNAFIAKVEEQREGFDLYVNPVNLARQMASMLKLEFGAKIKESAKLIGQTRDGRRKFRFSILVRLPSEKD